MSLRPVSILDSHDELGEGPLWCPSKKVLYWMDCLSKQIHSFNPLTKEIKTITLEQIITCIALHTDNSLLVTAEEGYFIVDLNTGTLKLLSDPYEGQSVIFNDGRCDRKGRFWSGTAAKDWSSPLGNLFRLNADFSYQKVDGGFILSNGIGFSTDNRYLYYTDSLQQTIFRYDFDLDSGAIKNRASFIVIPENEGFPDGMTVDNEGYLWVAVWDGWQVRRYSPQGEQVMSIKLPVPRPTSLAFGGNDYSTLYITTARMGLSETQLAQSPLSGNLFSVQTPFKGMEETPYAGTL